MGRSEVGVAMADASGRMKVSLHESGSWQYGYTSEYETRERAAGRWNNKSRHWKIWQRPREITPGYTAALKILVPPVALAARATPSARKLVRWTAAAVDRGVVFTVWMAKSSIPPWGYAPEDNELLGTIPLPSGEFVLIGAHYVSAEDSMQAMMQGLAGFLQVVMAGDTTALQPFSESSLLMGMAEEPTGTQVFTEIALRGIKSVSDLGVRRGPVQKPQVHGVEEGFTKGLMDIEARIPRQIFVDRGVDPKVDKDAAVEIAKKWNDEKAAEVRRLFGIPSA